MATFEEFIAEAAEDPFSETLAKAAAKTSEDSGLFNSGMLNDPSDVYANLKQLYISFEHVPTGQIVGFKGYITSWKDDYTSDWKSTSVYGRPDPIQTFQGTSRTMTIGWDVVASSVEEGKANAGAVGLLAKFQYPSYSNRDYTLDGEAIKIGTLSKAPLIRVQFTNLIMDSNSAAGTISPASGLLCAMNGISVDADLEAGVFDGPKFQGQVYPKAWKLSTSLKVLHQHSLGWDSATGDWLGSHSFPYGQSSTAAAPTESGASPGTDADTQDAEETSVVQETTKKEWDLISVGQGGLTLFGLDIIGREK